jgi:hypothetical protein
MDSIIRSINIVREVKTPPEYAWVITVIAISAMNYGASWGTYTAVVVIS